MHKIRSLVFARSSFRSFIFLACVHHTHKSPSNRNKKAEELCGQFTRLSHGNFSFFFVLSFRSVCFFVLFWSSVVYFSFSLLSIHFTKIGYSTAPPAATRYRRPTGLSVSFSFTLCVSMLCSALTSAICRLYLISF